MQVVDRPKMQKKCSRVELPPLDCAVQPAQPHTKYRQGRRKEQACVGDRGISCDLVPQAVPMPDRMSRGLIIMG